MKKIMPILFFVCLSGATVFLLAANPAQAADMEGFTSPSGNIACYVEDAPATLTCEINQTQWTPKGTRCEELDSGKQLAMTLTDSPQEGWWCRGDTWIHAGIKPLAYGNTWKKKGFTCESSSAHLACKNSKGHGWRMAKKAVEVF